MKTRRPGTRAISNDPAVAGVDYTRRLRAACTDVLRALAPDVPEEDAVVVRTPVPTPERASASTT